MLSVTSVTVIEPILAKPFIIVFRSFLILVKDIGDSEELHGLVVCCKFDFWIVCLLSTDTGGEHFIQYLDPLDGSSNKGTSSH